MATSVIDLIPASVYYILGTGIAIVIAINFMKLSVDVRAKFSYQQRDGLFTSAERSFLQVLNKTLSDDYYVFGKVRIADVITPDKSVGRANWWKAFNKISMKHFDYVICRKLDLKVMAAVELDDSSHNTVKAKARDEFVNAACESAELKLLRFRVTRGYKYRDVAKVLTENGLSIADFSEASAPRSERETA
ncbi:hypothetical protein CS022_04545 [Veronia nyctiphanis]|uniref:DUF2726 domain-containing protein n=1 Tax=Veronia nyctiphanis TaxID=1278244 RepID=A0A4Q0YVS2_9GAMM|nr:DUF2726 domain-containing protein [Veronia nyctiphanis]RXJ74324.1 hypothetical protein CS022_04545 [Veronia nyctiphanis]